MSDTASTTLTTTDSIATKSCEGFACPLSYTPIRPVDSITISPCGKICVLGVVKRQVELFDMTTGLQRGVYDYSGGEVAVSACGASLYSAFCDEIFQMDINTGSTLHTAEVEGDADSIAASTSVVVTHHDDGVAVFSTDLTPVVTIDHENCTGVAVSPSGDFVLSYGEEPEVRHTTVPEGEETTLAVSSAPFDVCVLPCGTRFVVASESGAHLYDIKGELVRSFGNAETGKTRVTACGKYLVSYQCAANELHQYDIASGDCVLVVKKAYGAFALSPCSRMVVFDAVSDTAKVSVQRLYQ